MAKRLSLEELNSLSRLLLSEDEVNIMLGLELLKNNPRVTGMVRRELILVSFFCEDKALQQQVIQLIIKSFGEKNYQKWTEGFDIFHQLPRLHRYSIQVQQLVAKFENIRPDYEQFILKNRFYSKRYHNIAYILDNRMKSMLPKAKEYYYVAHIGNPKDTEVLFDLAYLLSELNENNAAIQYYEQIISLEPKNALAYCNLGNLYMDHLDDNPKAYECFLEAYKLDPKDIVYIQNLGMASIYMNDQDIVLKGKSLLEEAITLDPHYSLSWNSLANYYWTQAHDYEQARATYLKGLGYDKNNYLMLFNLGEFYAEIDKNYEEAYQLCKTALKKDPSIYKLTYFIILLGEFMQNWSEVHDYYKQLLKLFPDRAVKRDSSITHEQWQRFLAIEQKLKKGS
ncbi:MAG: tetratricopeptide repeat protein [Aureispira sp.]|nr:tetratricopeptide repeat protein [Aureispira sp.]